MKKMPKGVVYNSFYKPNDRNETKSSLWGRTQETDMDIFGYEENAEGKIVIIQNKK